MLRVAAFTQGVTVPSARFRVRQYIPALPKHGVAMTEFAAKWGSYPPASKLLRPGWAAMALASRVPSIAASWLFDVVLLQREFLYSYATLERLCKKPLLLDVDDAIFLKRGGKAARDLARRAQGIAVCNPYLAEAFSMWNDNIFQIPTPVDTDQYCPTLATPTQPTIGWIGTSGNHSYLLALEPALKQVLRAVPDSLLRIVSDKPVPFVSLPQSQLEFKPWAETQEITDIQSFSVGIMPLADDPWTQGKCGFKLLQYMACGIPAVASPVGMNTQLAGILRASSEGQWVDAMVAVLTDANLAAQLRLSGRTTVESKYALSVTAPVLAAALMSVA